MSQTEVKSRAEEILFPGGDIQIPSSLGSKDVTVSIKQLRQLIDEKIVEADCAANAQPTLEEFLDFSDSLVSFLNDDIKLQLEFSGSVCFILNQVDLSIDSFELRHRENSNIDRPTEILPIVSKFVYQHGADEFTMSNKKFFAWWD